MSDTAIQEKRIPLLKVETPEVKLEGPGFQDEKYVTRMTEENWRNLRRTGIGGSDAGAVVGLSETRDTLLVYMSKVAGDTFDGNDFTDYGQMMEDVLRTTALPTALVRRGLSADNFKVSKSPWFYRSTEWPWMVANIDGCLMLSEQTQDDDGNIIPPGLYGIELKASGWRMAKKWQPGEAPDEYFAQVQHYMATIPILQGFILFALVDRQPVLKFIPANPEFIEVLVREETDLWKSHVLPQDPPAPRLGVEGVHRVLMTLFGTPTDDELVEKNEVEPQIRGLIEAQEQLAAAEKRKKQLEAELKFAIGDAQGITTASGCRIKWSRWQGSGFDEARFKEDHPDLAAQYVKRYDTGRLFPALPKPVKEGQSK